MALRFIDSMQHYNGTSFVRKYTSQAFFNWNASGGRRNGPFLSGAGASAVKTLTHQANYIQGAAVKYANNGYGAQLCFLNDNTNVVQIFVESDATVSLFSNGARMARSSLAVTDATSWHYYELFATVSGGTGTLLLTATARVDGQVFTTYTGTTNITGGGLINGTCDMNQCGIANSGTLSFQDFYCIDTNGTDTYGNGGTTTLTALLGDVEIDAIFPASDIATENWTIGAGGDGTHSYTCINEAAPDDDTSYLVSSNTTSGTNNDQFHYQPITGFSGTILGAQYLVCARKDAEGIRGIDLTVGTHTNSTIEFQGTSNYLSDYYVYYITPMDTDWGVAWTTSAFGTTGTESFGFQLII